MLQQKTYQRKMQGPHLYETKGPDAPRWYIVDANNQVVGRLATLIAKVLKGKHKVTYTPHVDSGDFVVVLNADKIVLTRNKWDDKVYHKHTGYMGGLKITSARQLHERNPNEILKRAVQGMLGESRLAQKQLSKLKLFTGDQHPHGAQNPQPLPASVTRRTVLAKG